MGNISEPVKKPTVTIPGHYKAQVNEQLQLTDGLNKIHKT